ncbi:cyclic nucleotide-binding domain protein (macronuclear) [Tetrahymena thermophila SB210]|uniref:Cyclic nucleotide-binding domain protein n=1 Tax=Tetrahymena thermophila (strain SB210) TaxID=312017 RepID=Q22CV3_TETTS|nr:cyclic nucleotide-binding domain protein [Tetrahymena thermophila SB210]EAR83085.2 cyclic nucleotide-binding domain protein [Tetrahymena thermophila SB210]|eukprot:XP_001030748.2 cyclic nucleotide-binding domain protein [Tetrahymena thermophila SB210]
MRSLRYVKLNKGSLVIKQGDQMNRNIYILLSGSAVELKKNQNVFSENITRTGVKDQFEIKQYASYIDSISKENQELYLEGDEIVKFLNEYGPDFTEIDIGEASGESVLYEKGPRTCTLLTITDAEFVTFDKNTFWKLQAQNNLQKKKIKEIIQKAININYDIYNQNTITQIVSSFQLQKIQKDEFLFEEGSINEIVYIVQGSCEIQMKYFIKKNFKKSISKDLKGTLVIENLTNGIFFVGDEIIFESWKKYKYSVRITAKNSIVYSTNIKDIEKLYDQATLNHMKEEYLRKMIVYKRLYDKKLQDIIQDSKKKAETEKMSNNSSIIKGNNDNQDHASSQNSNRKQNTLKNFISQSQNKEQCLNLNSFLKQKSKKKNNFDEILYQVQKDKLQTKYLEQNTIIRNCCFQMQQPTYYTFHRSLTFQPETQELEKVNQNQISQKNTLNLNLYQQIFDQNQLQNEKLMRQHSLENKTVYNNLIANHLEQEEWFPQQNDKIYLKKAKQRSIRISPEGTLLQKLDSNQYTQEPISQKSAFYSNQTDSFQLSQSKIIDGNEENNSNNNSSKQSSYEESPYQAYVSLMSSEVKQQTNLDKQYSQRQKSYNDSKKALNFSSQMQFYQQENINIQAKTLPNLMRNKNTQKEIFQQGDIQNQKLQGLQTKVSKEETIENKQLNKQNEIQMITTQINNYYSENNKNNQNDLNVFSNQNDNKLKLLSQSLNIDQNNKTQQQIEYSQNINPISTTKQIPILSNTAYNLFNISKSFSLEKQNNFNNPLNCQNLSESQIFLPFSQKQERIKKGLVLSRKDNQNFYDVDFNLRMSSAKSRRIHDSSPENKDTYYGIAYKKRIHFQKNVQFTQQKV